MIDTMFCAGTIKEDDWKTMVFINALQHEYYTPIWESLKALLTSTKDIIDFQGVLACLQYEAEKLQSAVEATAREGVHAAFSQKKKTSSKVCSNPNCLKTGHTIVNCWHMGGGDEGGGPRGHVQEKKRKGSETVSATVVDEKKEDTYISALADELTMTNTCTFHNTVNHCYDGYWLNLAI